MKKTTRRYDLYAVALFVAACILAVKWPSVVEHIRRDQEQARLDELNLVVGNSTFQHGYITGLSFSERDGGKISDEDLAKLVEFDKLESLDLQRCPVSNDGLSQLRRLSSLQNLSLEATQVDDAGMRHLVAIGDLRWLNLQSTKVSDSGLEELKSIESLQFLVLFRTRVTDDGVEKLRQALPHCKTVH